MGLPSEPVVLFIPGYDLSKPGIGFGGLVPPSLPTHHHIPPLSSSEFWGYLFPGTSCFEPSIGLSGLTPSPPRPTSTIPPLSFIRVCYLFFLGS